MISWIASYPKSGNTWVRLFLEAYITNSPVNLSGRVRTIEDDLRNFHYQNVCGVPLSDLSRDEIVMIRPAALVNIIHSSAHRGEKHKILKTHHANVKAFGVELIPRVMTTSAVYVTRDPRDVAVSFAHHSSLTFEETIKCMIDDEYGIIQDNGLFHLLLSWDSHVRSWMQELPFQVTAVRYEDMLEDPARQFKRVLEALKVSYYEDRFNFALEQTEFSRLKKSEQENGFTEAIENKEFFRHGKSGTWKGELRDSHINQLMEACPTAASLGYN